MHLLFCSDPLTPNRPDPAWEDEVQAASQAGLSWSVLNFEALLEGNPARAIRRVAVAAAEAGETVLFRGWMLRPEGYKSLYNALLERNLQLVNTPSAYRLCHYLPEGYPYLANHTPRTVWLPLTGELDVDALMARLAEFGHSPLVLKDYVKSAKHAWHEACFIPAASDRSAVERVVRRFLALQGKDLSVGLVFREYVELAGTDPARPWEWRIFFLDNAPLMVTDYWNTGIAVPEQAALAPFIELARAIPSRFFTLDIAQKRSGEWVIIEMGDGQVSGLPQGVSEVEFYQKLSEQLQQRR
ncbi:ATP-grasp domain-containing protein [Gloeobacter kilaueensis]|nr:ATP-grasp domain-containing protein [Gloeobacter kilaueensis]